MKKGKLRFISLFTPILLTTEDGEEDILDFIKGFFLSHNGKKAKMGYEMNSIFFKLDENSEDVIEFEDKDETLLIAMKKLDGFGFTNIGAYLPGQLERLNGRNIIVTATEDSLVISEDPEEKVNEVYYTDNNSCAVSADDVKSICGIGTDDCCIFIAAGGKGFSCEKFGSLGRTLLDRHDKGTMNATRIGNCKIAGRKDG